MANNTEDVELEKAVEELLSEFGRRYYEYHTDQDHLDDGVSEYSVKFEAVVQQEANRQKQRLIDELLVDVSSDSANIDKAEMISLLNIYLERLEVERKKRKEKEKLV